MFPYQLGEERRELGEERRELGEGERLKTRPNYNIHPLNLR